MKNQSKIQSLERAFDIIELLSWHPAGMQLMDIAAKTGLNKSTVHRFLVSLSTLGYIHQERDSKKYRLTLKLFEVSGRIVDSLDVFSEAKEELEKIHLFSRESIHLVARDIYEIVYINKLESQNSAMRMFSRIGMRRPMYCTAVGKSILATMCDSEIKSIWNKTDIVKYTANTITEFPILMDEINIIRNIGYALDNEENELGVRCISAAVLDYTNKSNAAFSVSAPVVRMGDNVIEKLAPAVLSAKSVISQRLGYTGMAI